MERLRIALLAMSCALVPSQARAEEDKFLVHPDARAHYVVAGEYAEKGDLRRAAAELDATYAIEPHPELLFMRAELRRRIGECVIAVALYDAFIRSMPSERAVGQARDGIAACSPHLPVPPPAPAVIHSAPESAPIGPTRPWHRDPASATLLALGFASLATAVGLAVPAVLERRAALTGPMSAYADHRRTSVVLQGSAIAAAAVSTALVVGAALRYRHMKRERPAVSAWFDGRSGGAVLVGRF